MCKTPDVLGPTECLHMEKVQWKVHMKDTRQEATAACWRFAKEQQDVLQHYWQDLLWTDEAKREAFGKKTRLRVEGKKASPTFLCNCS